MTEKEVEKEQPKVKIDVDGALNGAKSRMERSMETLHKELATIKTGRAMPSLLDRIVVDYYGAPTPLVSLATITTPDPTQLVIAPFDRGSIPDIEKAIARSDLGVTPSNDGIQIRINIPPLNEERRKEYVKVLHGRSEDARVAVRNIRRDEMDSLRRAEKDGGLSSDELAGALARLQKLTDSYVGQVDDIAKRKESELLKV